MTMIMMVENGGKVGTQLPFASPPSLYFSAFDLLSMFE